MTLPEQNKWDNTGASAAQTVPFGSNPSVSPLRASITSPELPDYSPGMDEIYHERMIDDKCYPEES